MRDRRKFLQDAGTGALAATLLGALPKRLSAQACYNIYTLAVNGGKIQHAFLPGTAIEVAGDAEQDCWVVNYLANAYEYNGSSFDNKTGTICPFQLGLTKSGVAWALDRNNPGNAGSAVCSWDIVNSKWNQIDGGRGFVLRPGDTYTWAISSNNGGGSFWRHNSNTHAWVSYPSPISASLLAVSQTDGTAYCQSNDFDGQGVGAIYVFSSTAASWSLAGGGYPLQNACLAPVDHTNGYLVTKKCEVWQYNPTTQNFSKITNQPPTTNYVTDAKAASDGSLWILDDTGVVYRLYAGSWVTSDTNLGIGGHVAACTNGAAYALGLFICTPTDVAILSMLDWYSNNGGVLTWLYGKAGVVTPTQKNTPTMWLAEHASTIASICSSGGTLPAYSEFTDMMDDYSGIVQSISTGGSSSWNALWESVDGYVSANTPPNTSTVQFPNPANVTAFADYMSGVYSVGAPTGVLQNGHGWLDIFTIPDFGTSTIPSGIVSVSNGMPTPANLLASWFLSFSSYSVVSSQTGACSDTIPKVIEFAACMAAMLHELCYGCLYTAWVVDPQVLQFLRDMTAMTASVAVATSALWQNGGCGKTINWSKWGSLT